MIFKKPYAFFIKNFKLFHFIICILASILLYRTSLIYSFVLEYVKTNPNLVGKELTDVLFVNWVYILIVFIILVNIVLIIIMVRKQKPFIYYVVNIALYVGVLVAYIVSNVVIGKIEVMLVESKVILAIRDVLNLVRMCQTISIIFYLIRATGFDIKKFDFVRDLQGLDISEEDSEEYEVAVEFEKNIYVRNLRKNLRSAKYYYKENTFIINTIIILFIGVVFLIIYFSIDRYSKVYDQGSVVNIGTLNFGVTDSFVVKNDYKGDSVIDDDNFLVALKVSMKSNVSDSISSSKLVLSIDNKNYYYTNDYSKSLSDLGLSYSEQKLKNEFSDYLLVYKIPKQEKGKKMVFKFIDKISHEKGQTKVRSIDFKLNPINIDEQKLKESTSHLSDMVDTSSDLSTYKFSINNYEISKSFVGYYDSCVSNNECYTYREILFPTVERSREKVLLKLDGTLTYDKVVNSVTDLYGFFSMFGSIEYVYNGHSYVEKADFNELKFTKINDSGYYIEVDREIMDASSIKLVFNIRNMRYVYVLKGDING